MSLTKATYSMVNGAPVNVLDSGADPTGVVDSSTAFTQAAVASGTQFAFVPKGTYKLTGTIAGNFYSVGGVTITSGTVTIVDVTAPTLDATEYASGPRDALCYAGAQSVKVFRNFATMGGFRFRGQYTKGRAPTFAMPSDKTVTSPDDLGGMTAKTNENWYAVFACANDGDATATLKLMPFLRALSISGSTINLAQFKEGMVANVAQTYAWTSANNLADTDLLVITEGGGFSGRVTQITGNAPGTLTVAEIGAITSTDTFLPAPPDFDHYVYLASFYFDTAEVRNIYDSGSLVKGKMTYTLFPDTSTGSFPYPTFTAVDCTGYISPLATAVVLDSSCNFSTATQGTYAEYFAGDTSLHVVQTGYVVKTTAGSQSVVFDNIQVPFLYPQTFAYANNGSIATLRTGGQFNITGWFEP